MYISVCESAIHRNENTVLYTMNKCTTIEDVANLLNVIKYSGMLVDRVHGGSKGHCTRMQ